MAAPAPSKRSADSRPRGPGLTMGKAMTKAWPAGRAAGRGDNGRTGPPESGGRYGLLLIILIASYLISAFSNGRLEANIEIVLFVAVLLIALRTSSLPGQRVNLFGAIVVLASLAALGASLSGTRTGVGVADIWAGLVLMATAVLIVRRVLARPTVTIQSIYGALSAYLIVGLMFAAFYSALDHLISAPFFADGQPATTQTFQYFSFTTLTTLGYGDFTAAGNGGRALAVIEALAGQVFLATLVARLVAAFRGPVRPPRPETSRRPRRLVVRDGAGLMHHRRPAAGPRRPSSRTPGPASRGLPYCSGGHHRSGGHRPVAIEGNASELPAAAHPDGAADEPGPPGGTGPPARRWPTRAQIESFIRAVRDSDQAAVDRVVLQLSHSRRWLAPLALAIGAFAMLFEGVKLLFSNWRLTLVQVLPAMWIWAAMYDLKGKVLRGKEFHLQWGPDLILVVFAITVITAASYFLNAVFAYAIAGPPPPRIRPAFAQTRQHLAIVLGSGAVVGLLLGVSAVVVIHLSSLFWFALSMSVVIGIMMVTYVAVPARLIGIKPRQSKRDKLTASAVGGAIGAVICTPPYALGRVGLIMLGSKTFFVLGIIVFSVGLILQAGATGAVKTIKMSAKLVAGRQAPGDEAPAHDAPPADG